MRFPGGSVDEQSLRSICGRRSSISSHTSNLGTGANLGTVLTWGQVLSPAIPQTWGQVLSPAMVNIRNFHVP